MHGQNKRILKNANSNQDFIGLPPELTNTMNPGAQQANFEEDEEEETDVVNNLITQAELFKNYAQ